MNYFWNCLGATVLAAVMMHCSGNQQKTTEKEPVAAQIFSDSIWFEYQEVSGIGSEPPITRRDPSDIIEVDGKYYVYYTKVVEKKAGYWGTIWYAVSEDEGYNWVEKGEALGKGEPGTFDSHAVFTPNILYDDGKYYLYYTAVKPTPGNPDHAFENNNHSDITAIGVAVSDAPDGPFTRIANNPVLEISRDSTDFDSYRVDDAVLLVKDSEYWMYYKGRSLIHGQEGPRHTQMGVAIANHPAGPYQKHDKPILDKSHEALVWHHQDGFLALASISSTLEFSKDGLNFQSEEALSKPVQNRPTAPGLFRPHLTDHNVKSIPGWGVSIMTTDGFVHLLRFEMKSSSPNQNKISQNE